MTERGTCTCDQFIGHPPADVWRALTDPEMIAQWWAPGDIRPVVGHLFTLDMGPWGQQPCEVIEVEPERLISYTFTPKTLGTTITWRLVPEGSGTRLFLEHSGFDLDSPMGRQAFDGMGEGWPEVVQQVATCLQTP